MEREGKYSEAADRYKENFRGLYFGEEPSDADDDIGNVTRVWAKAGKHFTSKDVMVFLLEGDDPGTDKEEREVLLRLIDKNVAFPGPDPTLVRPAPCQVKSS